MRNAIVLRCRTPFRWMHMCFGIKIATLFGFIYFLFILFFDAGGLNLGSGLLCPEQHSPIILSSYLFGKVQKVKNKLLYQQANSIAPN